MTDKAFFFLRLNDHVQYLKKIQATLDGTGEFQGTDYHDCNLGKWIYSTGPDEASSVGDEAVSLFNTLLEPHQQFHNSSHQAIEKQNAGDIDGANHAITEMVKLSNVLIKILIDLDNLSNRQ
ncbi:MAG: CZB domain-containing protein [Candidatus Thiodiazotropha sp. (ex Troendleina suluensis)]|nr:CZB domain-containing protein [Candidatus Thiodiazotropha sp. (ex Troendleina suluensis)]MCU7874711.1 CZB domain-containing protein [Candidatus Thiodiazotropha sp. (ex Lucinoma borealis)]